MGFVMNRTYGLTRAKLAVGTDSRSIKTSTSLMFSVPTEPCHVGNSWQSRITLWWLAPVLQCVTREKLKYVDKQRVLTPGHQGWNDLHSLCRIGMEYYLLNNNNNNNNNENNNNMIMMMMITIMIIIIKTTTITITIIMIIIIIIIMIIIRMMTIMKMIMIKTAQTLCQSLYKDRRI